MGSSSATIVSPVVRFHRFATPIDSRMNLAHEFDDDLDGPRSARAPTAAQPPGASLELLSYADERAEALGPAGGSRGPRRGGEFSEAEFPPRSQPPRWDMLRRYAAVAERCTSIDGLRSFLLAVAKAESDGNCAVWRPVGGESLPVQALLLRRNFERRFANNRWRPARRDSSDPMMVRWSYTGGWFGLAPAVALATSDRRGHLHDPALVFDPVSSVAYATDLVVRLRKQRAALTWGDVRAWWSEPMIRGHELAASRRRAGAERLSGELEDAAELGACPSVADESVWTGGYPGFTRVLLALRWVEGLDR